MRRQERTANNLANANTIGYKEGRVFNDILSEYTDNDGSPQSVNRLEDYTNVAQGTLKKTGNPLDVALAGDGFFAVRDDSGNQFYTRAGHFTLDSDGILRDANGYAVQGEAGPISLPLERAGSVSIANDGVIQIGGQAVDQLRVVAFDDARALTPREGAVFGASETAGRTLGRPEVRQGFVEESNVDPVNEMTDMIEQARMFESQQRWLRTTDQMLGRVSRELGKF